MIRYNGVTVYHVLCVFGLFYPGNPGWLHLVPAEREQQQPPTNQPHGRGFCTSNPVQCKVQWETEKEPQVECGVSEWVSEGLLFGTYKQPRKRALNKTTPFSRVYKTRKDMACLLALAAQETWVNNATISGLIKQGLLLLSGGISCRGKEVRLRGGFY